MLFLKSLDNTLIENNFALVETLDNHARARARAPTLRLQYTVQKNMKVLICNSEELAQGLDIYIFLFQLRVRTS